MLSSTTGVFTEPDDFEAAMRDDGCTSLVGTQRGPFRARLTRTALHRLRLQSAEESSARIAFFAIPETAVLVFIPTDQGPAPSWGGVRVGDGEIAVIAPGYRAHVRSAAGSRWGAILLPIRLLENRARTLIGSSLLFPSSVSVCKPMEEAYRQLLRLQLSAARVVDARASGLATSELSKSLELELLDAVVVCLSEGTPTARRPMKAGHDTVMARFEDLLSAQPTRAWTGQALSEALDLSGRLLRLYCDEHLGMGSNAYIRFRRMQLVRRALRRADPATARIAQIAAEFGFCEAGRFAGTYQAHFGELPSATLRCGSG